MSQQQVPVHRVNRQHIKQHFSHAAPSYDDAAILQRTVAERIDERLELTTIDIKRVLDVGAGTGLLTEKITQRYPEADVIALDLSSNMLKQAQKRLISPRFPWLGSRINSRLQQCRLTHAFSHRASAQFINADVYQLPFADGSMDMIVSNLMLQWCDDLDSVFSEFRRVLRPEGLLMFTTFGPDTLKELRQAWHVADAEQEHVNTFIDMHDIGDALIRAGLGQPVMDTEHFTLTYDQPINVLRDLKAIGATNAQLNRNQGLMGKRRFSMMLDAYEQQRQQSKIPATYEVVHGHAWASKDVFKGPNRDKSQIFSMSIEEFTQQVKPTQKTVDCK